MEEHLSRRALFRFYAELNDFLPPARRGTAFVHEFREDQSVKDIVESLGVPHAEIDLILVNGDSVDFTFMVPHGARVAVYPVFEAIDIKPLTHLRSTPLRETRFILDVHLGKLARYLRMVGLDTVWRNDYHDEELARIAINEHRIVLTRDRGLLKRRSITHGYWVREIYPQRQLAEIVHRFELQYSLKPFVRCMCCNQLLVPIVKEIIADQLPVRVREQQVDFSICRSCGRIYWKGSHHTKMQQIIKSNLDTF
jgi:hypothetical protein